MDSYLLSHEFSRCKSDLNVYMIRMTNSLLLLVLYVDDLLITSCSTSAISTVKRILHDRFLMMDIGPLHFFFELDINQDASDIKLSQAKYARDLLETFHMTNYKSAPTLFLSRVKLEDGKDTPLVDNTLYIQLVGTLLYLTHSRPDLSYVVVEISRFMQESHDQESQSVSFDTYRDPSPLGFTIHHTLHWTSSDSLILIGLAIALIASPHLVTHSVLVLTLSVGRARSKL